MKNSYLIISENADTIIEGFSYSATEKVDELLTCNIIKEVEQKLIKNVLLFPIVGGRNYRYLDLVLMSEK